MADLQVASTTDTQEQVNQAAGAVEIKVEPDEQVESEEQDQPKPQPEAKAEPQPKSDGSDKLKKRIDKLTAQKSAAESRAAALEAELAEAKKVKPSVIVEAEKEEEKNAHVEAEADDPEPKQEDFDTYEKWIKAQTRWEIRQEMREQADKEAKEAEDAAAREVFDTYNSRVTDFKETVDDWEETVGNPNLFIHPGVQVTLMEMEEGPQIAYMLGKNPELTKKLFAMSEPRAIAEIGKIAASLEVKEPEQPQRKTGPDKLPVSNAPAPIRQLTAHSTRSTVNPDEMDYADYRKWRDKQEKERYRR